MTRSNLISRIKEGGGVDRPPIEELSAVELPTSALTAHHYGTKRDIERGKDHIRIVSDLDEEVAIATVWNCNNEPRDFRGLAKLFVAAPALLAYVRQLEDENKELARTISQMDRKGGGE